MPTGDGARPAMLMAKPSWLISEVSRLAHPLLTGKLATAGSRGYHYRLLAALADPRTAAARTLVALGVDLDRARDALLVTDVTGTSDELPEEAGRRQLVIRVTEDRLTLEAADPVLVKAGREQASLEKMIEVKVSFDTDAQQAKELTRHWAALALSPEEKMGVEDPIEMERRADALPLDRAASRWIVSSDPDEQVERIRPYIELGFRHLVFHAPGPDQARFIKLYADEVFPRLRKAFG